MHAVTHFGEFNFSKVNDSSDVARTLQRLLCQMNHPSMKGRTLDLSALIRQELLGLGTNAQP